MGTEESDITSPQRSAAVRLLAKVLLVPVDDRWRHTTAVAKRTDGLASSAASADRDLVVAAAWLHDIGYAPDLVDTGMHAIDGARFLRALGLDERLCGLVAYHSGAVFEAEERGLSDALAEFVEEQSLVADALTAADFTTGPQGQPMTVDERIAEILARYDDDDPVHRAVMRSQDVLRAQVWRALERAGQPT